MFDFLTNADFPQRGNKRPQSWRQAVEALRGEMITHPVIVSAALLFCIEINIIDWQGVSLQIVLVSKSKHNIHIPNLQMYYVLLAETDQDGARHSHHTGNSFRLYREPLHAPIQTAIGSQGVYNWYIG